MDHAELCQMLPWLYHWKEAEEVCLVRTEHGRGCCAICEAAVVAGQICCWMGYSCEHGAGIAERECGKEDGGESRELHWDQIPHCCH